MKRLKKQALSMFIMNRQELPTNGKRGEDHLGNLPA